MATMKPRESQLHSFFFLGSFSWLPRSAWWRDAKRSPSPRRAFARRGPRWTDSWADRTTRHAFGLHSTIRVAARSLARAFPVSPVRRAAHSFGHPLVDAKVSTAG